MRSIFEKLGLTELMNAKTVYSDSAAHAVAEKKAELGFTQISEILNVPGATFAAPLPPEVQVYTTFAAAARPNSAAAARRAVHRVPRRLRKPPAYHQERHGADPARSIAADRRRPTDAGAAEAIEAFKTARGAEVSGRFIRCCAVPN